MPEVFKEGHTILGNISASAKLFLTKNMFAALLIALCAFLGLSFPLVPRHVTIMGLFTITIPALLITFTKRMKYNPTHFLKEILQFTFITGIIIATTGAFVLLVSQKYFGETMEVARTAMLTQVILLTLLNFFLVLEPRNPFKTLKESPVILILALSFLGIYFITLLMVTNLDSFNKIQEFLELEQLSQRHFFLLGALSLFSGFIMLKSQRWRAKKNS